jgi:hypothetical protein
MQTKDDGESKKTKNDEQKKKSETKKKALNKANDEL